MHERKKWHSAVPQQDLLPTAAVLSRRMPVFLSSTNGIDNPGFVGGIMSKNEREQSVASSVMCSDCSLGDFALWYRSNQVQNSAWGSAC